MHPEQARDLAAYNRWMNERLYAACGELTDAQRRRDCGAFFKSVHGTLNHLVLADQIWLGRFTGVPFHFERLDQELHRDFDELHAAREALDARIVEWAGSLTDDHLNATLRYTSAVRPGERKYEMWLAVTHFFNHQTHHRGQATTLLNQFGVDMGVTDLVWLPEVLEPALVTLRQRRSGNVEAQMHRRGSLVHMLPSRTARAGSAEFDLVVGHADIAC